MKYFVALSALTLCLAGCAEATNGAPSMLSMAARNGASWSHQLLLNGTVKPAPRPRPAAVLGPYVATFLSLPRVTESHAALSGIRSGTAILFAERGIRDESYAMLEELGLILHVDLADRLNRALDRSMSLDTYREGLVSAATRSNDHLAILADREDEATARVRELRGRASTIQRSLSEALRAKDYATAGSRQSELSVVQGELAVATAQQKEVGNIIDVFEDSLETAAERLEAIDANREALIAGVSVTDIPGTEDIGVLEEAARGRRRSDPDEVFGSPDING
jgi:hypothetical protein